MEQLLVPVFAFVAVVSLGGAVLNYRSVRRQAIQQRLSGLNQKYDQAFSQQATSPWLNAVASLGRAVSKGKTSASLKEQLARAGFFGESAAPIYMGIKIALLIGVFFFGAFLLIPLKMSFQTKLFLVVFAAAGASFLPNLVVQLRRQKRSLNVRHHLPDAVDLLEICVSSGIGLDMAWNLVTEEIRRVSKVLADEMALTNLEIHLGSPRVVAMRHMAERTGTEDLSSLVAVLVQSERFGTSVADALRVFASSMRESRSMLAEESAEKMAVKLLLPMICFIFPVVLMVMVGPAGIMLVRHFSK